MARERENNGVTEGGMSRQGRQEKGNWRRRRRREGEKNSNNGKK